MVRIAWRMMWQRPASLIATFVSLWFAVAMVTTCGAMLESGLRFHGTVARYAAAPVLVATTQIQVSTGSGDDRDTESLPLAARGRLPDALRDTIAAAPGVRAAVADVAVPARLGTVGGGDGRAIELHPWSAAALTPFTLTSGRAPAGTGQVVLDRGLAARIGARPGSSVRIGSASGTRAFTVSGIAAPQGRAPKTATAFVTDTEAAAQSAGSTQVIGVLPDPGVDASAAAAAVRAVLPQVPARLFGAYPHVFTGAGRGSVESTDVDAGREFVIILSSVFGGTTLFVAVFVIAGTVGQSVRQRHRDIALLRAIAATPRQVRRIVVRETLALGVLAVVAGIAPGLAGAGWLGDRFVARGLTPDSFHAHLSALPPLVAGGAALLVATGAAWVASVRASRIRPTEALTESSVERSGLGVIRIVLGLIFLAGGIVLCVVANAVPDAAAGMAVGTVAALVTSVALLSPLLVRGVAGTAGRALRLFGVAGRLAAANTATSAWRLSAVLCALVLAVALGGSLWFVQTSTEHAAAEQSRAGLLADQVVEPAGPGLPPAVAAELRHTPGVTAVTSVVHSTMFAPHSDIADYPSQGVDVDTLARTVDLDVRAGDLGDLRGDTVAVDTLTAAALDLHVGDRFRGWFGDGTPADLRVVAIYGRGLGFAAFTLARDVLAPHTGSGLDDAVFVRTGTAAAAGAVRDRLARLAPGASLLAGDDYRVGLARQLKQSAWANEVVVAVLLLYVAIAAVNTLVMYAAARRREFGVLRLSGTTRRQVLRMVGLEQVLLLGLGVVVGGLVAAAALIPSVKGTTGSSTPYIPLVAWVTVIGAVAVLGGVASALPARRILRTRPVEAIGVRE